MIRWSAVPALVVVLALACGGGSSSNTGGDPACQQVGNATCDKACTCTDGPGCNISSQGGLSITFNSEMDCRTFLVTVACSDPSMPSYNDAAACLPLVQAATCTGTGTDASLAYPSDMACAAP
jgi:hypothetical protein